MGGRIVVQSTFGSGSEFTFEINCPGASLLPFKANDIAPQFSLPEISKRENISSLRILLVEDNKVNVDYAVR
jgi:hypothetical protein